MTRTTVVFLCTAACVLAALKRVPMQVYPIEGAAGVGAAWNDPSIQIRLAHYPPELRKKFHIRMFGGTKEYLKRLAARSPLRDGCVRLTGFHRYSASVDASGTMSVASGKIDDSFLDYGSRWMPRTWLLVAEVGDVGDEDGLYLEAGASASAYINSGAELIINPGKIGERPMPFGRGPAAEGYPLSGPLSPVAYQPGPADSGFFGIQICYELHKASERDGLVPLLVSRAAQCGPPGGSAVLGPAVASPL